MLKLCNFGGELVCLERSDRRRRSRSELTIWSADGAAGTADRPDGHVIKSHQSVHHGTLYTVCLTQDTVRQPCGASPSRL